MKEVRDLDLDAIMSEQDAEILSKDKDILYELHPYLQSAALWMHEMRDRPRPPQPEYSETSQGRKKQRVRHAVRKAKKLAKKKLRKK